MRIRRRTLVCWAVTIVLAPASPLLAASHYLSPDVPSDLGAATFLPWEVVLSDSGTYSSALTLPDGTPIDALHRMDSGEWLFSVAWPVDIDGTVLDPRDVIRFDGNGYSVVLDGAAHGLPDGSNTDALFLEGGDAGDLILSFDVPTTIAGNTYAAADLVRFTGAAVSLLLDASAVSPAIPSTANVTGADQRGASTILTFAIPTTLGASTFLPGELVSWDGAGFASFHGDPSWPLNSTANGFTFLAGPGEIPAMLQVDKSAVTPGKLTLSWSASCSAGARDYGIYAGQLGNWYSHKQIDCSDDGGDLTEEIAPAPSDRYYLVVPYNPNDEGSYGSDSSGIERPIGGLVCVATQALAQCP